MKSEHSRKGPSASNMRVYKIICDFNDEHGYPPTYREVAEIAKMSSYASIDENVERLRDFGYLIVPPYKGKQRVLIPTGKEV